MYETNIDQAIERLYTTIDNDEVVSQNDPRAHPDARSFLRWAMQKLVQELWAQLSNGRLRWGMALLMSSNFLDRAAWDLFGPCVCGRILELRGEWGTISALRQASTRGIGTTLYDLGRNFGAYVLAPMLETSLPQNTADRVDALIQLTWQAHADFGRELCASLARDATAISNLFGVSRTPVSFDVASSDPHTCARRVVIVRYSQGGRVVYKPTDMLFQALLMGTPESLAAARTHNRTVAMRRSLFDELQAGLPLLHILSTRSHAHGIHGRGGYGYMEFKDRSQVVTTELGVKQHFHAMGKLAAVATLLGITDLHHENIMATAAGPVIIDGEMSLCAPAAGVTALSLTHTSIDKALDPWARPTLKGGAFSPYRNNDGTWDAATISAAAGDPNDVLSAIKPNAFAPWIAARHQLDLLVEGSDTAIDAMAARLDHVMNWLTMALRITPAPLARVILNTTDMMTRYTNGVAARINGTLPARAANNATFEEWLEWYGGSHNAVPGAWVEMRNVQIVRDSHGVIGVPVGVARVAGAKISTVADLRVRLATRLMGSAIERTKAALQTDLERTFQGTATQARQARVRAARLHALGL